MRQNLEPKVWGPKAWFFLESIAIGYPENPTQYDINNAKQFYASLGNMLPCEKCRENFKKHSINYPLTDDVLSSNEKLFKWTVDIHNIAKRHHKRSYEETFQYYMNAYDDKSKSRKKKYTIRKVALILFFILIVIFLSHCQILQFNQATAQGLRPECFRDKLIATMLRIRMFL